MILSIFGFAGGVGMPMQTSVNAQLGRRMGSPFVAAPSFSIWRRRKISKNKNGATGRDRTGYLHVTNVLLCQVSYSGPKTKCFAFRA